MTDYRLLHRERRLGSWFLSISPHLLFGGLVFSIYQWKPGRSSFWLRGVTIKSPRARLFFSERYGHEKPTFTLFGWRVFVRRKGWHLKKGARQVR